MHMLTAWGYNSYQALLAQCIVVHTVGLVLGTCCIKVHNLCRLLAKTAMAALHLSSHLHWRVLARGQRTAAAQPRAGTRGHAVCLATCRLAAAIAAWLP